MTKNLSGILRNLSYTFLSNLINLLSSFILVFFVPKFIGVESYAYWQLYIFYTTYLQYFTFGIPEGIYLEYGGYTLDRLPKKKLRNQFGNLLIISLIITLLFGVISVEFIKPNFDKMIIILLSSIAMILIVPRTVLTFELQTTNEIKKFSLSMIFEKSLLLLGVSGLILFKQNQYWQYIIVDLTSKLVTNVYIIKVCKDFVFGKYNNFFNGVVDSVRFIKTGINITLSNVSSILVMGIIRFMIEMNWSIKTFGKISLIISMNNMIMVFINSVSIVIFPLLKRSKISKLNKRFKSLDFYSSFLLLNLLLLYYPIYVFLYYFLPDYREALVYLTIIFPTTIFESQVSILYNTYLKAFREEKVIFKINIAMVLITFLLALPAGLFYGYLPCLVMIILLVSSIKYLWLKNFLYKYCLNINMNNFVIPILVIFYFVFANYTFNFLLSFISILVILIIVNLFVYRKKSLLGKTS